MNKSGKPKYLQIKEHILLAIEKSKENQNFLRQPLTETELAREFSVSRLTARQALKELEREGIVYSVRGVGTFLTPGKLKGQLNSLERFYSEWAFQGKKIDSKILCLTHEMKPPVRIALELKVSMSDNVTFMKRIRSIDGISIVVDHRFLPVEIGVNLTEEKIRTGHLYEIVAETSGIQIGSSKMEIEASLATDEISRELSIKQGSPLLVRTVTILDLNNTPIITGSSFYRADLFKYVIELP